MKSLPQTTPTTPSLFDQIRRQNETAQIMNFLAAQQNSQQAEANRAQLPMEEMRAATSKRGYNTPADLAVAEQLGLIGPQAIAKRQADMTDALKRYEIDQTVKAGAAENNARIQAAMLNGLLGKPMGGGGMIGGGGMDQATTGVLNQFLQAQGMQPVDVTDPAKAEILRRIEEVQGANTTPGTARVGDRDVPQTQDPFWGSLFSGMSDEISKQVFPDLSQPPMDPIRQDMSDKYRSTVPPNNTIERLIDWYMKNIAVQ